MERLISCFSQMKNTHLSVYTHIHMHICKYGERYCIEKNIKVKVRDIGEMWGKEYLKADWEKNQ